MPHIAFPIHIKEPEQAKFIHRQGLIFTTKLRPNTCTKSETVNISSDVAKYAYRSHATSDDSKLSLQSSADLHERVDRGEHCLGTSAVGHTWMAANVNLSRFGPSHRRVLIDCPRTQENGSDNQSELLTCSSTASPLFQRKSQHQLGATKPKA